jgi:hypothetical protein
MGVDATVLLRVPGDKPSDDQVARWADALCRSIGATNFFLSPGLPSAEYHPAHKAWHAAFMAHALYDEWNRAKPENKDATRAAILADIGKPPEQLRRALQFTNELYPLDNDCDEAPIEYRAPGRCYLGEPAIWAAPNEWLLEVSLWSRYYGAGYERGDILMICGVAEWCEQNIPGCEVWYGGDGRVELFDAARRADLRAHLYGPQGRNYFRNREPGPKPSPCSLCIDGGEFDRFGWGPNYTAVHCGGCGKGFTSRDGGSTWTIERDRR